MTINPDFIKNSKQFLTLIDPNIFANTDSDPRWINIPKLGTTALRRYMCRAIGPNLRRAISPGLAFRFEILP